MAEEIIFQKGNIIITPTMARFGGATYPIAGIGSVFVQAPQRAGAYTVAPLVAGAAFLAEHPWTILAPIIGALIALAAFIRPFKLMLRTASGDQQALSSRTANLVEDVKAAIEQAVMTRG